MGAHLARRYAGGADTEPDPVAMPTFPPELGMPGREPRTLPVSARALSDGRIPLSQRDFCSALLLQLRRCHRDAFPALWHCSAARHRWEGCLHEDYVMRMKEFERERRLLQRQARIRSRERAAATP